MRLIRKFHFIFCSCYFSFDIQEGVPIVSFIKLINEFTSRKFDAALVKRAKAKAESSPHLFWAKKIEFMKKRRGGGI